MVLSSFSNLCARFRVHRHYLLLIQTNFSLELCRTLRMQTFRCGKIPLAKTDCNASKRIFLECFQTVKQRVLSRIDVLVSTAPIHMRGKKLAHTSALNFSVRCDGKRRSECKSMRCCCGERVCVLEIDARQTKA